MIEIFTRFKIWLRRSIWSYLSGPTFDTERFGSFEGSVHIDPTVYISNIENVFLGKSVAIYRGTKILCADGQLHIGNRSHLSGDVYINAVKGKIVIGEHVAVGPKTVMVAHSNVFQTGKLITETYKTADILIGNNVLIGASVTILPGIVIGSNSAIGAGAVVTRDVPEGSVVAGVPARIIRKSSI